MRRGAEVVGEDRVLPVLAVAGVAAVAAVQPARVPEPPVPAAGRLEQVAADRAHVPELRRGGGRQPPAARRGARSPRPRARERRPGADHGRRRRRAAGGRERSTSVSASRSGRPELRHDLRPAREQHGAGPTRSPTLRRPRRRPSPGPTCGSPTCPFRRASARALSISSRVIGSERISAPVASRIAFAIAAATGMIGGSPSPFEPRFVSCASGMSIELADDLGHVGHRRHPVGVERPGEDAARLRGRFRRCSESVCPIPWMITAFDLARGAERVDPPGRCRGSRPRGRR